LHFHVLKPISDNTGEYLPVFRRIFFMTDSKAENKTVNTPGTVEPDKKMPPVPAQPQQQGEQPKAPQQGELPKSNGPQQQAKA
jgi:hypothetical protein